MHHPSLFFLYETHGVFAKVERFWLTLGYNLPFFQEAFGFFLAEVTAFSMISSNFQAITFSLKKGSVEWFCSAVYASPVFSMRNSLWDHLISPRSNISGPWILQGDFNEIKSPSEVSGGSFSISGANNFVNMMKSCDPMDLDSTGGLFTWRKNIQFWYDR